GILTHCVFFLDDKLGDRARKSELTQAIKNAGGKVVERVGKTTTHVITNDVDYSVNFPGVKIVTPIWLSDCVETNKVLSEALYDPNNKRILKGVVATTTQIPANEQLAVANLILTSLGAEYSGDLHDKVTHLIAYSKPCEGDKYEQASKNGVKIVSYEWLNQCGSQLKRLNEDDYPLKEADVDESLRHLFEECVFTIDEDQHQDAILCSQLKANLLSLGGVIQETFDKHVTHVICRYSCGPIYKKAMKLGTKIVTAHWLDDCIRHRQVISTSDSSIGVFSSAIHKPLKSAKQLLLQNCEISVTGWQGADRSDVMYLIKALGGQYTGTFSKKNTHLICSDVNLSASQSTQSQSQGGIAAAGKKIQKAIEWNIPVLKKEWLLEVIDEWKKVDITDDYLWIKDQIIGQPPAKKQKLSHDDGDKQIIKETPKETKSKGEEAKKTKENTTPPKETVTPPKKENKATPKETTAPKEAKQNKSTNTKLFVLGSNCDHLKDAILSLPDAQVSSSDIVDDKCTHVVLNGIKRTEKYLCGCSGGKIIVRPEYITESEKQKKWLSEEDFIWDDNLADGASPSKIWKHSPKYWRDKALSDGCAFENKTIILFITKKVPPKEIIKRIILAGKGNVIECDRKSSADELKNADYALVDGDAKASDKFIKVLRQNKIKMYRANLLLDMFTLEPPISFDQYE
ncbi:hypothetical protein AKO1_011512, partial [Acrasis kona]